MTMICEYIHLPASSDGHYVHDMNEMEGIQKESLIKKFIRSSLCCAYVRPGLMRCRRLGGQNRIGFLLAPTVFISHLMVIDKVN